MADSISNSNDIIDSRDVIARIEELRNERDSLIEDFISARDALDNVNEDDTDEAQEALDDARQALELWIGVDFDEDDIATLDEDTLRGPDYASSGDSEELRRRTIQYIKQTQIGLLKEINTRIIEVI